MQKKPYLLFDAGGTILFPDFLRLAGLLRGRGCGEVTPQQLHEAYYRAIHTYDVLCRDLRALAPVTVEDLLRAMLAEVGVPPGDASAVADRVLADDRGERFLWRFTYPEATDALAALRERGYSMSVISNSDGRVAAQLAEVGLADSFERIFDSAEVGFDKPDPRLFAHALEALELTPRDVLYVGDIYAIDVAGANAAGIGAIHLDPLQLYVDWPGVHLAGILALCDWLAERGEDWFDTDGLYAERPRAKAPR